jgi:hypothetical protein
MIVLEMVMEMSAIQKTNSTGYVEQYRQLAP